MARLVLTALRGGALGALAGGAMACAALLGAEFDDARLREDPTDAAGSFADGALGATPAFEAGGTPDSEPLAGEITPRSLDGLALWLTADRGALADAPEGGDPALAGRVGTWLDRSPATHHATQPHGRYRPSTVEAGGRRLVQFGGPEGSWLDATWSDTSEGDALTVVTVVAGDARALFALQDEAGTFGVVLGAGDDPRRPPALLARTEGAPDVSVRLGPSTGLRVVSARLGPGEDGVETRENGAVVEQGTLAAPLATSGGSLSVGRARGAAAAFATSQLGELVVVGRALRDDELEPLERYLRRVWGIR